MNTAKTCTMGFALAMCGCASLDIRPIAVSSLESGQREKLSGYIVYEPVVAVEISKKDECIKKDSKGNCLTHEISCSAGAPFLLPDYTKPYVIDTKSGFGKAGADITIVDGWRLGNIKDSSDNTAILGSIEKILGSGRPVLDSKQSNNQQGDCKASGLYRVTIDKDIVKLTSMFSYP